VQSLLIRPLPIQRFTLVVDPVGVPQALTVSMKDTEVVMRVEEDLEVVMPVEEETQEGAQVVEVVEVEATEMYESNRNNSDSIILFLSLSHSFLYL
jgi:hypothetical protein